MLLLMLILCSVSRPPGQLAGPAKGPSLSPDLLDTGDLHLTVHPMAPHMGTKG